MAPSEEVFPTEKIVTGAAEKSEKSLTEKSFATSHGSRPGSKNSIRSVESTGNPSMDKFFTRRDSIASSRSDSGVADKNMIKDNNKLLLTDEDVDSDAGDHNLVSEGTDQWTCVSDVVLCAEDAKMLFKVLSGLPCCKWMRPVQILLLMERMVCYEFRKGEYLFKADDVSQELHVIWNGSFAQKLASGQQIGIAGRGMGPCGDETLLRPKERPYGLLALETSRVFTLKAEEYSTTIQRFLGEQVAEPRVYISHLSFFENVPNAKKDLLAYSCEYEEFQNEDVIFEQGAEADAIYLLKFGVVKFVGDGEQIWIYKNSGDLFGEAALVNPTGKELKRLATAVAAGHTGVYRIAVSDLNSIFGERDLMSWCNENLLVNQLSLMRGTFGKLPYPMLHELARKFTRVEVEKNDVVLDETMQNKRGLIFVEAGELAVKLNKNDARKERIRRHEVYGLQYLEDPNLFVTDYVKCSKSETTYFLLTVEDLLSIIESNNLIDEIEAHRMMQMLEQVFIFRMLAHSSIRTVCEELVVMNNHYGEVLCTQGQEGDELFLVMKGQVNAYRDGKFVTSCTAPFLCGELAVMYGGQQGATITISSKRAEVWIMSQEVFDEFIRPSEDMMAHLEMRTPLHSMGFDLFNDFDEHHILGEGGTGQVSVLAHKKSKFRYALKTVKRDLLKREEDKIHLLREREILACMDHPFILSLVRTFKDDVNLYLLMELVSGGDLLLSLEQLGILNREQAQFYIGSLILVFHYLADKGIVYRDLKPENILVDQHGFMKLVDFGLAKRLEVTSGRRHHTNDDRTFTLAGTPQFMPPELLVGNGFSTMSDLWAVGVCAYEFMVGVLPFGMNETNQTAIFQEILQKEPEYPAWLPTGAEQLLKLLLMKSPHERSDHAAIAAQPFFDGFSFQDLQARKITPPFVPGNEQFNASFEACPPHPLQRFEYTMEGNDWAEEF